MAGFNPGDVFIDNITIVSPRTQSWNMAPNFLSASVTETIFTPGVTAEIEVVDTQDFLGKLKLAGDETVQFQFSKPNNGGTAKYEFHLNNVKDVEVEGALKAKVYKLICISRETLTGQAHHVQKAYNSPISDIIKDLFGMLGSKLKFDIEETKGKRKKVIANQPLYHAKEMLRKEAVSMKNKSSNFLFFITQTALNFKSIEGMLSGSDVKTFKQDNTVGSSIASDIDSNILAWQVKQNMDAFNRIKTGAITQKVATFNVHTNEYRKQDFKKNLEEFINLGAGLLLTQAFKNLFPKANRTFLRYINPNDKLKIDKSHMPESVPYKQLNLAQMQEQLMHMTIFGDPNLEAGKTINCNVPKIADMTNNTDQEPQVSGRWLISKLEHKIHRPEARPRYTCNLECIKGAYQEKV